MTETRTYAVKYARGVNHIEGLDEIVNTGASGLTYATSHCAALSKSNRWCSGRASENLVDVLESARLHGGGRGVCKKCEARALEMLAEQRPASKST